MRRPLCLLCMVFVGALVIGLLCGMDAAVDYGELEGRTVVAEGQVYRREYKGQKFGTGQVLVVYLKGVHIVGGSGEPGGYGSFPGQAGTADPERFFRGEASGMEVQKVVCYMEEGSGVVPEIGKTVRVSGKVRCFSQAGNWGEFDMQEYYRMMKLSFRLEEASVEAYGGKTDVIGEKLHGLREYFAGVLRAVFPEKEASILQAMLLGEKDGLDSGIKKLYRDSSIIHILSISGLHISIIGMGFYRLLRKMGIPLKTGAVCSVGLIWCYGLMTGMSLSALRAIVMFALHLLADMAGRTYDMLTALAVAAMVLLLEQPAYLRYSGFLFSFGAVVSIGVLLPVLFQGKCPGKRKWLWQLKQAAACCGAVTLGTLPVHLMFYYQFPLYSYLLNLAVIPLMTVVMADGLFCMLAGGFLPVLAQAAGLIDRAVLWFYEQCCLLGASIPYGVLRSGRPENWQLAVYVLLLAVLVAAVHFWREELPSFMKWQWILASLCLLFLRTESGLRITLVDVGQGDCIHIQSDEGKHYLIDAGSTSKSGVTEYQILPYLKYEGVGKLEAVFVTHSDSDHCSAVLDMLEEYPAEGITICNLILPAVSSASTDEKYMEMVERAGEHGIRVHYMSRGQYMEDGGLRFTCMHPYRGYDTQDPNEYSLVMLLEYGSFSGLFTGDLEGGGEDEAWEYMQGYLAGRSGGEKVYGKEEWMRESGAGDYFAEEENGGAEDCFVEDGAAGAGDCFAEEGTGGNGESFVEEENGKPESGFGRLTLLKVAHHGSAYSTREEMLAALRPRLALISCGEGNRYGHPHEELLERLDAAGCLTYITAQGGAVRVITDGERVWTEQFR